MQKPRGRVRAHHLGQVFSEFAFVLLSGRHDQAHAGFAVVLAKSQNDIDRQCRAVREQRIDTQWTVLPASLQAGGQGTLERRVRPFIEQIHEGLAHHGFLEAEKLQPRCIGIDDDALLDLHDGIVRALQHRFQLTAGIVGRFQCRVESTLQTIGAQLAQHHRLQSHRVVQRHYITRADLHRLANRGFIDAIGNADQRQRRHHLVADCDHSAQLVGTGHVQQQFGVELHECVGQIAQGWNPGAMHRVAGATQAAVDRLDRITCRTQDYERHRVLLSQFTLHDRRHKRSHTSIRIRCRIALQFTGGLAQALA